MQNLQDLLRSILADQSLTYAVLSNLRHKTPDHYTKVTVKPVLIKQELKYQLTYHFPKKTTNENLATEDAEGKLMDLFSQDFKNGLVHTQEADYQILISKKDKVSILKKAPTRQEIELTHNRKKKYLLEEGTPVPFLIELGVMNREGKVLAKKYDKFKQINRFLEMIDDVVPHLKKDRTLNIIDFGCGKSYLTFALYHYLQQVADLKINVIGLDLKKDVIEHCNALACSLNYENLRFQVGDINQYNDVDQVDMVVTLHACDTATDAALEKAVRWGADVILSVPCCQHELFTQVSSETMSPMLRHGIIKERFSALATDSVRAQILDMVGYKTQMLEFIDLEHTPKNLLIRAVKQTPEAGELEKTVGAYLEFKRFLNIEPFLEKALKDRLEMVLAVKQGL